MRYYEIFKMAFLLVKILLVACINKSFPIPAVQYKRVLYTVAKKKHKIRNTLFSEIHNINL